MKNPRFPQAENYFLLSILIWAVLTFFSVSQSGLSPKIIYEFSAAKIFKRTPFAVPAIRAGKLELILPISYSEALHELQNGSESDKESARRVSMHTSLILLWWPILSVAVSATIWFTRWLLKNRHGSPQISAKNQIRGTQIVTRTPSIFDRIAIFFLGVKKWK